MPNRPDIPVTLYALVVVLIVEQAVLRFGFTQVTPPFALGIMSAVLVAGVVAWAMLRSPLVPLVLGMGLCALLSSWALSVTMEDAEALLRESSVSSLEFEVTGDPRMTSVGYRCRAAVFERGRERGSVWLRVDERLDLGQRVRCVGRFEPNGDDSWGVSARAQGVIGTVTCVSLIESEAPLGVRGLIARWRDHVVERIVPSSSDARAILAGSTCGVTDGLRKSGLQECFARCGVAHLVAVSGSHIAVVSGLLGSMLEFSGLGAFARSVVLLLASGLFVLFCGVPVSALRAWIMAAVGLCGMAFGRRAHSLSAVCAVGLALALLDPGVGGQLAYLLSVTSVVGLCVFSPYMGYVIETILPTPRALMRDGHLFQYTTFGKTAGRRLA